MAVLLIAEHNNKELRPFTLNAATAASQIDDEVHAVIIGQNSEPAAKKLSESLSKHLKKNILRKIKLSRVVFILGKMSIESSAKK